MNLLKLLSPEQGINLIRGQIKKQLKKDVTDFDILFLTEKDMLYFIIEKTPYEFPSEMLKQLIEKQSLLQLKPGDTLTGVELQIRGDQINAKLYIIKNNEKIIINHAIN